MIVAHADWGAEASKQWVAVARRDVRGRWNAFAPYRVGKQGPLGERLELTPAVESVVIGFDFPIGVPRAYARAIGATSFMEFPWTWTSRGEWREFFEVADDRHEITLHRPFYPRTYLPKGSKRREHLHNALGMDPRALLRRCDQATSERPAACPLFWTCGGNQVGKGALAGWKLLRTEPRSGVAVWPFDGPLPDVVGNARLVVAETYPAEFAHHIGLGRVRGKRKQEVRRQHALGLLRFAEDLSIAVDGRLEGEIRDGFGATGSGEDKFDAVVGLLGMLNVLEQRREPGDPVDDGSVQSVEGWMLGQAAI